MNNFRAFVEREEEIVVEVTTPTFGGGLLAGSKEKINLEMGAKLGEGSSGFMLPEILRNLDYEFEEDQKSKEEGGEELAHVTLDGEESYITAETPLMHSEAEGSQECSSCSGGESDSPQTAAAVSQS